MNAPGPEGSGLFRRAALERLSSPEQIDRMARVTAPFDWLAALAVLILIAAALAWAITGSVTTVVSGSGILIPTRGRVAEAVAEAEGTLVDIRVTLGDTVAAGEVLARIDQSTLRLALENARRQEEERAAELRSLQSETAAAEAARAQTLTARRTALDYQAAAAAQRRSAMEERYVQEERLQRQGLLTVTRLLDTQREIALAGQSALDARTEIAQLEADEIAARHAADGTVRAAAERLAEARDRVAEQELRLARQQEVKSPDAGRVTEIRAAAGSYVSVATPVIGIETGTADLQLVLYIPPDQGKRVRPGMPVRIAPSTVKAEEHGTLMGHVRSVSDFPTTAAAMRAVLGNDGLVQRFSVHGAPIVAEVALERDPAAPSGYRWSSGAGPAVVLTSGTLAEARVTVRSVAPITLIAPFLRKITGLEP